MRVTLSSADKILGGYLAALAAVALLCLPHPTAAAGGALALIAGLAAVAWLERFHPLLRVVHDFDPIPAILLAFNLSGPVISAANPRRWDAALAAFDRRYFAALAEAWYHALGRPGWLTDAASIAYVSYYFLPVVLAVALYAQRRREEFTRLVVLYCATFVATWILYFCMPALGPRVALGEEDLVLGGGAVSHFIRGVLRVMEGNLLDAMPSGHTAVSVVGLYLGWKLFPRWRAPIAVTVFGIVFSTVYLSLHYVVDIVAGAVVGAAMPLALEPWRDRLQRLAHHAA